MTRSSSADGEDRGSFQADTLGAVENGESKEDLWAVSVGASGVQAHPGPDTQENPRWPLLDQVRGVLPDGAVVDPRPAHNQIIFEPPLPPGSKVFAGEILLAEIVEMPSDQQE